MTTVIRLNNADFNNPNLPIFIPVESYGLVSGYTFDQRINTLKGESLEISGTLEFDSEGVTIDNLNDQVEIPVKDSALPSITIIFIGSILPSPSTNTHFVGRFADSLSMYAQNGRAMMYAKDDADGSQIQTPAILLDTSKPTMYVGRRDRNGVSLQVPGLKQMTSQPAKTAIRMIDGNLFIGSSTSNEDYKSHCNAVLIYDRLLSDEEIARIHYQMRNYFSAIGLDIL
ncbi:TPA: hypothetical protein LMR99_001597 [Vibrio alginolyticus]|nr:hypothetical protein [Vibrio alginolyticus]ELB2862054.1 hypothetical protein [Vibrio alginolyticus]HBK5919058.1 hypothetical protein [Vibrio alginolyticus]HBK6032105.1 hypothetical protein [Vibrio alginolyticus]